MHFEIQADDVERAKGFYEKAFNWKIEKWKGDGEKDVMDYWMVMTGEDKEPGINGGMYQRPADRKLYTYDCTISVDDIDQAIEAVKANGGTIRQEKMELKGVGWFAGAIDTEGNNFALMQPKGWQPK
jgi:predicted enzyme related to lactoylglutathione lyase